MKLNNFKKFVEYYGKDKSPQLVVFFFMSLIAGFLEFVGIALIYPFIMMIISPQAITTNSLYLKFIELTRISNAQSAAFAIGFLVLLIFILKNFYIIFNSYVQSRFVTWWKRDLTRKFMEFFLYAPYKSVMNIPQSDKLYILSTLITQSIDGFVMRALNLITNTIIITMIIGLLFVKFPIAASVTILFVLMSMSIQNQYFKDKMSKLSIIMNEKGQKYNRTVLTVIDNIKEIKINSSESEFYTNYSNQEIDFREIQIINGFYSSIPPYIIEILIVVSLLLLGAIVSVKNLGNNSALVASYAIIAAAIFRIAPALNRIQTSILNINASREFVKQLNEYYNLFELYNFKRYATSNTSRLDFNDKIELKDITFAYVEGKNVINNVSLTINKGDFIGIIGLSGAGKSTLADIIMGLLPVQSGEILVDGEQLNYNKFCEFRNLIGYVPQEINVLDTSFKDNVIWTTHYNHAEDEDKKVIEALKDAQLYDIVSQYEDGIYAKPLVNSTGLSQGQKQRLAIARALYKNPDIIILDEATSSLDVQTEHEITEMLQRIGKTKTIIAIAHRLSTLKTCNKLVYMKSGHIVDIGTFEELSQKHADFENLLKLSSI